MAIAYVIFHNVARRDGMRDVEEDTIRLVLVMQNFKLLLDDSSCHCAVEYSFSHSMGCGDIREVLYRRVPLFSLGMHVHSTRTVV